MERQTSPAKGSKPRSPCELLPPCQEGNHGSYINSDGEHYAAKPIGKYYFTEDALKHDLAALRKGEFYERDEFYKRAKAWYKAEIDRLVHLEKVLAEISDGSNEPLKIEAFLGTNPPSGPRPLPSTPSPTLACESSPPKPPKHTRIRPPIHQTPPTRIQPDRAAKRKRRIPAPTEQLSPLTPRPPRMIGQKKQKTDPSGPIQIQIQIQIQSTKPEEEGGGSPAFRYRHARRESHHDVHVRQTAGTPVRTRAPTPSHHRRESAASAAVIAATTGGDYALAAHDWAQFRNGNAGEHRPSPWSYVQLQGLDVAYFCMRVERAVRAKVEEIRAAAAERVSSPSQRPRRRDDGGGEGGGAGNGGGDADRDGDGDGDGDSSGGGRRSVSTDGSQKVRCALLGGNRYVKPPPFEPAAALAPGEDWRPPATGNGVGRVDCTDACSGVTTCSKSGGVGNDQTGQGIMYPSSSSGICTASWAADEIERRQEMIKRAGQTAPEAEMEISPTLGRWSGTSGRPVDAGSGSRIRSGRANEEEMPVEDLSGHVVEVSGLRFAVDLCLSPEGSEENARFLML